MFSQLSIVQEIRILRLQTTQLPKLKNKRHQCSRAKIYHPLRRKRAIRFRRYSTEEDLRKRLEHSMFSVIEFKTLNNWVSTLLAQRKAINHKQKSCSTTWRELTIWRTNQRVVKIKTGQLQVNWAISALWKEWMQSPHLRSKILSSVLLQHWTKTTRIRWSMKQMRSMKSILQSQRWISPWYRPPKHQPWKEWQMVKDPTDPVCATFLKEAVQSQVRSFWAAQLIKTASHLIRAKHSNLAKSSWVIRQPSLLMMDTECFKFMITIRLQRWSFA